MRFSNIKRLFSFCDPRALAHSPSIGALSSDESRPSQAETFFDLRVNIPESPSHASRLFDRPFIGEISKFKLVSHQRRKNDKHASVHIPTITMYACVFLSGRLKIPGRKKNCHRSSIEQREQVSLCVCVRVSWMARTLRRRRAYGGISD